MSGFRCTPAEGQLFFGPLDDVDRGDDIFSPLQRESRLCASCHEGTDVSEETGLTMGRWAWSSNFVDLNNDGWDDLLVANGYITTDDSGDL